MAKRYDVIVAGAGPAGLVAARAAGENGFDVALLENVDEVGRAVENVGASIGTDGLPASVRHLVGLTRDLVTTFDKRDGVVSGIS